MADTLYIIRHREQDRYAQVVPFDGSVVWLSPSQRFATRFSPADAKAALEQLFPDGIDPDAFELIEDRPFRW